MLITAHEIKKILLEHNIPITGVLHVGAHECEEMELYKILSITPQQIVWIDAMSNKVDEATAKGIPNVYHAVITDTDDAEVAFNIANNGQSSSILEMGTHAVEHPHVSYIDVVMQKTITLPSFFKNHSIDPSQYSFWNFDIQGVEFLALKGGESLFPYVTAMYLEVNEAELYKGCKLIGDIDSFLSEHGFQRVITRITKHGWGDALYIKVENKEIQPIVSTI